MAGPLLKSRIRVVDWVAGLLLKSRIRVVAGSYSCSNCSESYSWSDCSETAVNDVESRQ